MMNYEIRNKSKEIIKANLGVFIIAGLVYYVVDYLANMASGNIIVSAVMSFVKAVASASAACFYIRAFNKGAPDIRDMYDVFTYPQSQSKFFSIVVLLSILNLCAKIATALFLFVPIMNLISVFVIAVIGYFLNLIWYLYVTNPDYPTEYYVKASISYMSVGWFDYFMFILGTAILPAIAIALVTFFLPIIAPVLSTAMDIYIATATAGYVRSRMIPSEWYYGGARF